MNKNDGPKKNEGRWICLYILAIIGIAGLINLLMSPSIPSISSIDAPTWLTFWGSYLGGAIGCLPAIAALQHSRREARRQHLENEKNHKLSALPVFACTLNSFSFMNGQVESLTTLSGIIHLSQEHGLYGQFCSWKPIEYMEHVLSSDENEHSTFFELRNIGAGPALNVSLAPLKRMRTTKSVIRSRSDFQIFLATDTCRYSPFWSGNQSKRSLRSPLQNSWSHSLTAPPG